MSRLYKVLSIDFDYFVDALRAEKYEFPDPNENLSMSLNTHLWSTHYANWRFNVKRYGKECNRLLTDIPVNSAYNPVMSYLKEIFNGNQIKTVIANSHATIFPYLEIAVTNAHAIKLCNLDDHSDFYGIGEELNCGNWGNLLYELIKKQNLVNFSEITWVGHSDSICSSSEREVYETYRDFLKIECTEQSSMQEYLKSYFEESVPDLVFLCRSSCWTPPHLDYKFLDMVGLLQKCSDDILIEDTVLVPRYTKSFKKEVSNLYSVLSKILI